MPANEAVNLSCQSPNINGGQWDGLGSMLVGGPGCPFCWPYVKGWTQELELMLELMGIHDEFQRRGQ